jgi:hypothetical protein
MVISKASGQGMVHEVIMKPLVKKVLEAGLVEKHTALMLEKWRLLQDGAADLIGTRHFDTQQALTDFVEEIEELLDAEPTIKETRLDYALKGPEDPFEIFLKNTWTPFSAYTESCVRLIVTNPVVPLIRGCLVRGYTVGGTTTILEVDPIYNGDTVVAVLVTLE